MIAELQKCPRYFAATAILIVVIGIGGNTAAGRSWGVVEAHRASRSGPAVDLVLGAPPVIVIK